MSYDREDQVPLSPDYLGIVKRRKWQIAIPAVILLAVSVIVIATLPPVYRSSGTILVETQQIPQDFVRSTVTSLAEERIQIIQQRVMTREKLQGLADKHELFANEGDDYPVSVKLDRMRSQIFVDLIRQAGSRRRGSTAIAFTVAYESESPGIARAVANDLVTLFLEENVKSRTERATETTEFLENEADKLKRKLDSIESAIADYKQENKDALPEHLDIYMASMDRAEVNFRATELEIRSVRQQLDIYQTQLASLEEQRRYAGSGNSASMSLADLKTEYARLRSQYNDNHPRIQLLAEEIRYLEESIGDAPVSGDEIELRSQMAAAESRISSLERQRLEYEARAEDLQERIIRIPLVERGLKSLSRDYENAKNQYDEIFSKGMQAGIAESLEEGRKAERFSVIEPPLLPDSPVKPDRLKLLLAGVFLSFAAPIGIIVLLEMTDKSIRGVQRVIQVTEHPPLVVIPLITTPGEEQLAKRYMLLLVLGLTAAAIAGVLAIHFLYTPLDLLSQKAMHRFGIG